MTPHVAPALGSDAYNCPHCSAYSHQTWHRGRTYEVDSNDIRDSSIAHLSREILFTIQSIESSKTLGQQIPGIGGLTISKCEHCSKPTLWLGEVILWPKHGTAPPPHPDLPADIRCDYEEASTIAGDSPRGAAALLRLAIEKLCRHLAGSDKSLNDSIKSLVRKGLDKEIQEAMDIVRVIGNHAVHPGQIDLQDKPDTAETLFHLVNLVVEVMISRQRQIAELFETLPQSERTKIARRDNNAKA